MDLNKLTPHLLHTFKSEHDLVRAIEELSLKFTKERDKVADYLTDARLISAYTAFYLTTNYAKFEAVLKWMPEQFKTDWMECDFIDVGAGPGTFSLAFKDWATDFKGDMYQIENSALMREQGKKIWQAFHPEKKLQQDDRVGALGSRPRFLLFGHSANEMGPEAVMYYIYKIKPDHVLFIEPGTPAFFADMLKIRDALIAEGMNVLYPCPGNLDCPMKGTEEWCHQFVEVSHSADVERLTQMVKKDRRLLPLTVHAFSKKTYGKNPEERIVRVLDDTKFSFEWEVCHNHQLEDYQIMKRPYSKAEQKTLRHVLSGASIETQLEKEIDQVNA